jgi:hypothetical protein
LPISARISVFHCPASPEAGLFGTRKDAKSQSKKEYSPKRDEATKKSFPIILLLLELDNSAHAKPPSRKTRKRIAHKDTKPLRKIFSYPSSPEAGPFLFPAKPQT